MLNSRIFSLLFSIFLVLSQWIKPCGNFLLRMAKGEGLNCGVKYLVHKVLCSSSTRGLPSDYSRKFHHFGKLFHLWPNFWTRNGVQVFEPQNAEVKTWTRLFKSSVTQILLGTTRISQFKILNSFRSEKFERVFVLFKSSVSQNWELTLVLGTAGNSQLKILNSFRCEN